MLELRTLGTIELRAESGDRVDSVQPHSKRLSLLAYLAASHPPGLHRRDTLVALLWPELDEEHARGALRHELYELRRALGPDALRGEGTEAVGVEPQRLWCDAAALEAAADAGRFEEVLELWRGEFLPGLHVPGGEFERWLDGARDRLARRVTDAGRHLSVQAEEAGDHAGAVAWARRLTVLAPYDETGWQRLIVLLDRLGDRAGALKAYEELTRLLREELEVEPSPETRALVEGSRDRDEAFAVPVLTGRAVVGTASVRTGVNPETAGAATAAIPQPDTSQPAVAAGRDGRWRRLQPLRYLALALPAFAVLIIAWAITRPSDHGPVLIELPEVENVTRDTTLDALASWLEEWLSAVLGGTDFVQLINAGAPERARAAVQASVIRRGSLVGVHVRIVEPGRGGRVDVPAVALLDPETPADSALAVLESQLLGALAIKFDKRFEAAGTTRETLPIRIPRYHAYRVFLRGQDLFGQQDYQAAVPYLLEAYATDRNYGKAAVFAAIAMAYAGQLAAADSFISGVLVPGDSLTDRDRAFGEWLQADVRGDRDKALRAARMFEETSVGASPSAYAVAATEAMKFNLPREALARYERVNVEHGWLHNFSQLWEWWAGAQHMIGEHRQELAKALEGRKRFPESLRLIRAEVRARAARHQTDRVQQLIQEALTQAPGESNPADIAWIAAQELDAHGHEAAAAAARRTGLAWLNQRQDPTGKERTLQVRLLLELGDAGTAHRLLGTLPPRADPDWLGLSGLVAARRGDTATARELLTRLDTMRSPYLSGRNLLMASGIRAALGQREAAVQTLQRAFAQGLPYGVELHALPMLRPLARWGELDRLLRPKG